MTAASQLEGGSGGVVAGVYGVHKRFGGVHALRGVTLEVRAGEVHCLIGENGAGKSTLVKLLAGVYQPDVGQVRLGSQDRSVSSPHEALQLGVSTIFQEFTLVPEMTVAENVFLGREPQLYLGIRRGRERDRRVRQLLSDLDIRDIDPRKKVKELGVAHQQMVEITKSLSLDGERVLILDEPTASLTANEIERLFALLRGLRRRGVGLLYITHRLNELRMIGDVVTVMRDGAVVMSLRGSDVEDRRLIEAMVGRPIEDLYPSRNLAIGEPLLEVRDVSVPGRVWNASLDVRRGEVVALFGLVGAGRTELVRALVGADRLSSGVVILHGRPVNFRSPADALAAGVGFVPEDRKRQGLVPLMSVAQNIGLGALRSLRRAGIALKEKAIDQVAEGYVRQLRIRVRSIHQAIETLSGGNQQKVVLARVLAANPSVVILDEPTRGIDVGARSELYRLINQLCVSGKAVLMVSSDVAEAIGVSDRVLVMRHGRLVADLASREASQPRVMEEAFGVGA